MKCFLSILLILHLFIVFYCFSLSVFSSSVSSWGPTTLGAAFGSLSGVLSCGLLWPGWLEDSAPWCGSSCLPGSGLSLWRCSLWSWPGSPLSVVGPQGWLFPCLRFGCPAVSLSDRCSGSELVCLYVHACVWVCVHVCICLSPYLSGYLWGWEGWYVLSLLFLASVRHFVLLLKYERCHTNKV